MRKPRGQGCRFVQNPWAINNTIIPWHSVVLTDIHSHWEQIFTVIDGCINNVFFSVLGFPGASDGKESSCNVGHLGLIPWLGRSPGVRKGYPLQYSGLENSMACRVHGVTKRRALLNDFHFYALNVHIIVYLPHIMFSTFTLGFLYFIEFWQLLDLFLFFLKLSSMTNFILVTLHLTTSNFLIQFLTWF